MKREELIAYDRWLTENKWGSSEIVTPEQAADLYLAEHPLPPAEGAETILKEGLDDGRYADITDGINIDVKQPFYQAIIRYAEDVVAAQPQPTAEGAEEILEKYGFKIICHKEAADAINDTFVQPIIAAMQEYATLHAQRIADKVVSERLREELIKFCRICVSAELIGDEIILVDQYLKSKKR